MLKMDVRGVNPAPYVLYAPAEVVGVLTLPAEVPYLNAVLASILLPVRVGFAGCLPE